MVLPLDGFRVLDLTRFLSGPYCTMVLAELGADVIKVEQPVTGDDSRRLAPKVEGESYPFAMPNRSKRSISLNATPAGATAIYSVLAAQVQRSRTGEGQSLDISLVDAGLAWTVWESGAWFGGGEEPAATGTRHRRSTPYQAYRTSDGYVTI